MPTAIRVSPMHETIEAIARAAGGARSRWGELDGMPVALDFGSPESELVRARELGLCDASALPRLVVKGPQAANFLRSQGLPVPEAILAVSTCDGGGVVARTGGSEFLLEDSVSRPFVAPLEQTLGPGGNGVYRVVRQDAVVALSGRRGVEVLRQVCGYDFVPSRPGAPLVMTRVAGVSCLVLHRERNGIPVFQLSTDGTLGVYLWGILFDVVRELGGDAVGLATLYPALNA
jgi:sarcosine oxidase subunit gamma